MPAIRIVGIEGRIQTLPLSKKEISLGRSKDNDVVLLDHAVSRYHARIIDTKEGYLLTDLGSFNGTAVNGKSIQNVLLKNDDEIRIGHARIVFLGGNTTASTPADSLILTTGSEDEKGQQTIIKTSPEPGTQKESQELLVSVDSHRLPQQKTLSGPSPGDSDHFQVRDELSSLERSNKVLFVLYEISRQLNSIHDFDELLNKIMDLIFIIIDADYGFLILTGEEKKDELIPVVVKSRDGCERDKRELKASRTIIDRVIHDKVALLTSNAMDDNRLDHAKSLFIKQIRSAICVPLWKKEQIIGVIQLDSVRFDNQFTQDDLELLKAIGSQMAMVIEQSSLNQQIREEERMRSRLERFIPPQIIDMVVRGGQELMEPNDLTATIVFTDIVGFTPLSEAMPPRDVNVLLNHYFSKMTDIIFKYDGTLDKYVGDGLMAIFGAPVEKEDDPERAIMAAKEMLEELAKMREKTHMNRELQIRIGINTGRVVAGNIGSPQRMDYTVIGDAVNIASRLETLAAPNQILIGEETYRRMKGKCDIREVGARKIKGKTAEIMVYEVV